LILTYDLACRHFLGATCLPRDIYQTIASKKFKLNNVNFSYRFEADTAIKKPTKKARRVMYKVMTGDRGMLNFKVIKNFEYNLD
jgi:hypothetical protein